MAAERGPMSGFRDLLADQMIPRQEMLGVIQGVYEGYGFTPLQTPALERYETLMGKYGEEGEKLIYQFRDHGDRHVAMRYDQTVPLARVVALHANELPMPYKRYAVGEVWRGERPQASRYREFTQFDADTVGTKSPIADAEIVAMMSDTMGALGAGSLVRVNNRRILDGLVKLAGAEEEADGLRMIGMIDRVEKIGQIGVREQVETAFGNKAAHLVDSYLNVTGSPADKLAQVAKLLAASSEADEGLTNLTEVFAMLEAGGYDTDHIVFDQAVARGLDYYTGIIYETTLIGQPAIGSVCSGGRFDNLIEQMGGPDLPAVGTSIGVDRLYDGLHALGKLKEAKTTTEALIANFDTAAQAKYMRVATLLRQSGVAAEIHYGGKKLGKQISFADKMQIPFVVIVGPDEEERGTAVVKALQTRDQTEIPLNEVAEHIKELRSGDV